MRTTLVTTCLVLACACGAQQVTVTPEETVELLANPGMGWETFHWTSATDKNLPPWLPSTVQYIRWGWKDLEPEHGVLNTNLVDRALRVSRESGQRLAFRVMCCSPYAKPYHPAWLSDIGGRVYDADHNGKGPFPIPDMGAPAVLNAHLDFIKRLGARYDGHPDLDHVDLGSMGAVRRAPNGPRRRLAGRSWTRISPRSRRRRW
jgi:hypothetical protein